MRIITLALRSLLAVVLAVALALPTGLAAAQDLTDTAQQSDDTSEQSDDTQSDDATTTADTTSNDDGWKASDATAFTDFSDKTITRDNAKTDQIVYLMVDSQFVSKDGGKWTEGVGPKSDGTPLDDVYRGKYTGSDQVVPDRQDAVTSDGFLSSSTGDSTKLHYYWDNVGTASAGGMWSDLQTNLKGDSFEGLYVYYKNQLRTRLAWAGQIDGATWVVPWDASKTRDQQCNPSSKTNDANKCFMTKLASDAYLAMSFSTSGSKTINYEIATSAGNAIGLASDTGVDKNSNPKAENDEGTILNRSHEDNQPTILRRDEKVRPGYDFTFNVQLSHGGTYLRVFYTESDKESDKGQVNACPADSDVTNSSNPAFLGTDNPTNLVYAQKIPGESNAKKSNVEVADTSDATVKEVTINGAATADSNKTNVSVCVQEVYWYLQGYKNGDEQMQTVRFSSTMAQPNRDSYRQSGWVRGGMYMKMFKSSRAASGSASGKSYYPADNTGPNSDGFSFNSCAEDSRFASYNSVIQAGQCSSQFMWINTSRYQNIPADGASDGSPRGTINPGYTFFEQLRYANDYGDPISYGSFKHILKGQAGKDDSKANAVSSTVIDLDDPSKNETADDKWKSDRLTATIAEDSFSRGDTVSFLVMDTMRVSNGNVSNVSTTDVPSNLSICVGNKELSDTDKSNTIASGTNPANCQTVEGISDLLFASTPSRDSYTNSDKYPVPAQVWDATANKRSTEASYEYGYYSNASHSTTVTLTKGALKGTRVTLTFLPNFYRDGDRGFGGEQTNNTITSYSIHPLLVTVENITTNIDMHLSWAKTLQSGVTLGSAQGLEDLQIARPYYDDTGGYKFDVFQWGKFSSTSTFWQWHEHTSQLSSDNMMVIKFKIALGYSISGIEYKKTTGGGDSQTIDLDKNVTGTYKTSSEKASKLSGYFEYDGGPPLTAVNTCLRGDTDDYYYCAVKGSDTNKMYTFSFTGVTAVNYAVNYVVANDEDGVKETDVNVDSYEKNTKYYNQLDFAGNGVKVTTSCPTINNNLSSGSPKFFLYWEVVIAYLDSGGGAAEKEVTANSGDSKDTKGNLVVYPGQRVKVSNYYSQMPTTTTGVKLKARWTTALEYEAVTRQVTAWVQTFNSSSLNDSGLWHNWSATAGSGTDAVKVRQDSYLVLIPQSNASEPTSYASTYPAYEGTTKQNGKGFLPKSATLNYVSNGTGGWTQQSTNYTLVSDEEHECETSAQGTGVTEYCDKNDIKKKMGAKPANPSEAVPDTLTRDKYGYGQMMVGYYRVELSDDQKVSYKTNVCAKNDETKTDCAYDYEDGDNFEANVNDSWLFRGHYLFDHTRVPTSGTTSAELQWTRLKDGSTSVYRWLFKHWSLNNTQGSGTTEDPVTTKGTYIGLTDGASGKVVSKPTYYARWDDNTDLTLNIRTEKTDGTDLENGAVFQLYMWDWSKALRDPDPEGHPEDIIERDNKGKGKAGSYWRPVIQYEPTGTDDASLANYVTIPTVAEVSAGTAGEATPVTTSTESGHTGIMRWRGISNGYTATGADLNINDYKDSTDAEKKAAWDAAVAGKITLPIGTLRPDVGDRAAAFKGAYFALIQVKAPSSKYVCNTGQWIFQISDYVSGTMSTIGSPAFAGSLGVDKNSVYSYGRVGGTKITPAGTVHAIVESKPLATTLGQDGKEYPSLERGAAVVNIDAFDLPAAGWRLSLSLLAVGLALTALAWTAYALNHRRRAQHIASA